MSQVFISYSHEDDEYVDRLYGSLKDKGFDVWIDQQNIRTSDRWFKSIENAIVSCSAFVVVMTPEADDSPWVEKEIMIALECNKPIFSLLLRGKRFRILNNIQCEVLKKELNYLPSKDFIKSLSEFAPRNPQITQEDFAKEGEKRKQTFAFIRRTMKKSTQRYKRHSLRKPILKYTSTNSGTEQNPFRVVKWLKYQKGVSNDFGGTAMLALSCEAEGGHERAMYYLRKAQKMEERVIDKEWMKVNYGWTDEHLRLLDCILKDEDYWRIGFDEFENYFTE